MNIITNIRQLKILVTLSQLHVDNTEDQLVEMWLSKIEDMERIKDETTQTMSRV